LPCTLSFRDHPGRDADTHQFMDPPPHRAHSTAEGEAGCHLVRALWPVICVVECRARSGSGCAGYRRLRGRRHPGEVIMAATVLDKPKHHYLRFGKYQVFSHLATGGMAAVYRAVDLEEGREVALKVLAPDIAANSVQLERFRREARHAARLRHANIANVYEFGEANGIYYLALEFVDGMDLHEYIYRQGRLDPDEALPLLLQVVSALDHAHAHGIVHRDTKRSNTLLTQQPDGLVVKLTDFGLARATRDDDCRLTAADRTVGTIDYMAPEQARDSRSADTRSDIYSLGCTLYQMLAGRAPF